MYDNDSNEKKIYKTRQEKALFAFEIVNAILLAFITICSIILIIKKHKAVIILSIIFAGISLVLTVLIFIFKHKLSKSISLLEQKVSKLESDLKDYDLLKYFTQESSKLISKSFSNNSIENCVNDIKFAILSLYNVCKDHFIKINGITDDFHVRFMTEDYLYKTITIPVFDDSTPTKCPTSMAKFLDGGNPYSKSFTALIYKKYEKTASEPEMYICENTEKDAQFQETSYNQKQRIKSMIVYPITYNTKLLGTLVLQCNVPNFFKNDKKDLWKLMLDVYAICLGKEKEALDTFVTNEPDRSTLIKRGNDKNDPLYYFVQPINKRAQ